MLVKTHKTLFYIICSIFLILLPKVSESSESLADYKIIANNQNTNIELKKLIYYLEQFQINYVVDKNTKWVTNKKYINDNKVIIEDNLTTKNSEGGSLTLMSCILELQKKDKNLKLVQLDKLTINDLEESSTLKGNELVKFILDAQKIDFKLTPPSNNEKNSVATISPEDQKNMSNTSQVNTENNKSKEWSYLEIGGLIFVVFVIIFIYSGEKTSCPKCKKWFKADLQNKKELSRRNSHKTVKETTTHKDRNGRITGTTEKEKKVPITLVKYEMAYKCSECSHEWTDTVEEEA
jgi:hypothetical protein